MSRIPFGLVLAAVVVGSIGLSALFIAWATAARPVAGVAQPQTAPPQIATLPTPQPLPTSAPTSAAARVGKAEVNLGTKSVGFGTTNQARELLALMDQQPGRAEYTISYATSEDVVIFGCDLTSDVLARLHQDWSGHGTKEGWRGYTLDRLRHAANGDSLNDTPAGKSLVDFQRF